MATPMKNEASSHADDNNGMKFKSKAMDIPEFLKFSLYSLGLVAICSIAFLIAASRMTVKPLDIQVPSPYFNPEVSLTAEAISIDPVSRTIVMNWYPNFTSISCQSDPSDTSVVDIYVKSVLLDVTSPSWSPNLVDQPAYRLNNTEICQGFISTSGSFRTVTKLTTSKAFLSVPSISNRGTTYQDYPFDVYLAPFLFYTRKLNSSTITPLEVSGSFGIAVNFKISLLPTLNFNRNDDQGVLQFYLQVERLLGTKAFVVLVAISNWLMATAFLIISAASLVYRSHEIYSEMFVVPVGALFAFSSVRANLPGAPAGFGATIDLFTIIPVLVIMSFCSFGLLLIILYRRIRKEVKRDKESRRDQISVNVVTPMPHLPDFSFVDLPRVHSRRSSSDVTRAEE